MRTMAPAFDPEVCEMLEFYRSAAAVSDAYLSRGSAEAQTRLPSATADIPRRFSSIQPSQADHRDERR